MPDCSPEAMAQRDEDIRNLRAKIFAGVTSVADRGRSVSYTNPQWLWEILKLLQADQDVCMGKPVQGTMKLFYVPLVKNL